MEGAAKEQTRLRPRVHTGRTKDLSTPRGGPHCFLSQVEKDSAGLRGRSKEKASWLRESKINEDIQLLHLSRLDSMSVHVDGPLLLTGAAR